MKMNVFETKERKSFLTLVLLCREVIDGGIFIYALKVVTNTRTQPLKYGQFVQLLPGNEKFPSSRSIACARIDRAIDC